MQCVIPHWPAAQVRARVKLNLKNLYQANGFAVKELLKVAALLHQAHRGATDDDEQNELSFDLGWAVPKRRPRPLPARKPACRASIGQDMPLLTSRRLARSLQTSPSTVPLCTRCATGYCHNTRTKRRRDAFRRVLVGAGRARRRKGGCRSCAGQASRRRFDAQAACEAVAAQCPTQQPCGA